MSGWVTRLCGRLCGRFLGRSLVAPGRAWWSLPAGRRAAAAARRRRGGDHGRAGRRAREPAPSRSWGPEREGRSLPAGSPRRWPAGDAAGRGDPNGRQAGRGSGHLGDRGGVGHRDGAEDGDDRSAGEEATGGEPRPCVHVPLPQSDSSPNQPRTPRSLFALLNGRRPSSEHGPEGMRLSSYSKPAHSPRKGAGMRHPGPHAATAQAISPASSRSVTSAAIADRSDRTSVTWPNRSCPLSVSITDATPSWRPTRRLSR